MVSVHYYLFVFFITVGICTDHHAFFAYTTIAQILQFGEFAVLLIFSSKISIFAWYRTVTSKMTHFSTINLNSCHIGLALSLTIFFRFLHLLFVGFVLRVLFFLAFLVRTICCFVSNLSTVATSSFELFFLPFLFGRASKQCIVVFFFLPALDIRFLKH